MTWQVTCLQCGSVLFSGDELLDHIVEEGHVWYKIGERYVVKFGVEVYERGHFPDNFPGGEGVEERRGDNGV